LRVGTLVPLVGPGNFQQTVVERTGGRDVLGSNLAERWRRLIGEVAVLRGLGEGRASYEKYNSDYLEDVDTVHDNTLLEGLVSSTRRSDSRMDGLRQSEPPIA
jgi:hypothetical protein